MKHHQIFSCYLVKIVNVLILCGVLLSCSVKNPGTVQLRKRTTDSKIISEHYSFDIDNSAIVVVDMWNAHHCKPAEERAGELAFKIEYFLEKVRKKGVQIIFAPSGTMKYYAKTENRKRIASLLTKKMNDFEWLGNFPNEPQYPIEFGCSDPKRNSKNFNLVRQNKTIQIHEQDVISDKGNEIVNYLKHKKIKTVFFVGVHTNVCVAGRPFGMRSLKKRGFDVILIRDLTDSYIVRSKKVNYSHSRGHELIINHIEKYVAPTIRSEQLLSLVSKGDLADR